LYTDIVVDHFTHPRNVGRIDDADGIGRVDDRATDNLITIYLKLGDGNIAAARFRTFGCSACIAASSVATELVVGRSPADASRLDAAAILAALGGLPAGKEHCAELVARALREALEMAGAGPDPARRW
jgi:nitrogen fixation NifU-like protein